MLERTRRCWRKKKKDSRKSQPHQRLSSIQPELVIEYGKLLTIDFRFFNFIRRIPSQDLCFKYSGF